MLQASAETHPSVGSDQVDSGFSVHSAIWRFYTSKRTVSAKGEQASVSFPRLKFESPSSGLHPAEKEKKQSVLVS